MKKTLIALITLVLALMLALTSCEGIFGTTPPTGGGGDTQKPADSGKFTRIVYMQGFDIQNIHSAVRDNYAMLPAMNDSEAAELREIVIGETNRDITAAAKAKLEEYIDSKNDLDFGYIVYCDGKSVALYWQNPDLETVAVTDFVKQCIEEDKLVLKEGSLICKGYNKKKYEQESLWEIIEMDEDASPELIATLRELNSFYEGSQICAWMANLWDPEIGGFYYANSSRDNEPFLPDLESTNQLTGWLTGNGAFKNTAELNAKMPNEIKIKIVDFARNMQYPDGYFYHPQWPIGTDKLNTDRYGRDLSWGVALINRFTVDRDGDGVEEKQYPKYCTPSGAKCQLHTELDDGTYCNLATSVASVSGGFSTVCATSSISTGVSAAISKMPSSTVNAVVSKKPDYSSSAAFTAWLKEYNSTIKTNSGNAHNINALQDEIIAKGFCDELVDFLEDAQEEVWNEQTSAGQTPSGLWQYEPNMRFVWGILKYMPFYNAPAAKGGRLIKHAEEIIDSCVEVILQPADGSYAMNDLMNQTSSISSIISNIRTFDPDNAEDRIEAIQKKMKQNGAALIENCMKKLEPFKLENGTFVYTYGGTAPATIYGVPISLGQREADVNGNSLCSSYYRGMFALFGYTAIPLCNSDDGDNFLEIIINAENIEKIPQATAGTMDFENTFDVSDVKGLSYTKYTSLFEYSIETDEDPYYSNVLYFHSGNDGGSYGDYIKFAATGNGGNCNIFEFDFKLRSTSRADMFQVKCGDSFMFHLDTDSSKRYMKIEARTGTAACNVDLMLDPAEHQIDIFQWNRIRFEMYTDEEGNGAYIKLFVNDEYIGYTEEYFGAHTNAAYNPNFSTVSFCSRMNPITENYFDNVYAHRENKVLDLDSDDISDARDSKK